MIAALASIAAMALLGLPIALGVDRNARGALLAGVAFLYGSGASAGVLLALSAAHVRWSMTCVSLLAAAALVVASAVAWRSRAPRSPASPVRPHLVDLVTLATLAGYALQATLAPLPEWDFWAIWGLKARVFLEAGGLDWRFLEGRWNLFAHPDYPLLVPLDFDFVALAAGWNERALGLLFVAWGAALLLVARSLAAREAPAFLAALVTLALAAPAFSREIGLAEGALIAFGGAGVLFVREALRSGDAAAWRHGALMLGFAANCKNEGIALAAAAALALAILPGTRGERLARVARLWPAAALAAPWLVLRAIHAFATDLAAGGALSRFAERLPHAGGILALLAARLDSPWFWAAAAAGLAVATAQARRREAFLLATAGIELAFFVLAYLATPYNVQWHVLTSWPRLATQLAVPVTFAVFMMLAASLRQAPRAPVSGGIEPGQTTST